MRYQLRPFSPACDDGCSAVLLDDLDRLNDHFLSVSLSAVAMAPYRQLVLLENRTKDFKVNSNQDRVCKTLAPGSRVVLSRPESLVD